MTGIDKVAIFQSSQEKYFKREESPRPSKMTFLEAPAPESTEVAASTAPMFHSLNSPANCTKTSPVC